MVLDCRLRFFLDSRLQRQRSYRLFQLKSAVSFHEAHKSQSRLYIEIDRRILSVRERFSLLSVSVSSSSSTAKSRQRIS